MYGVGYPVLGRRGRRRYAIAFLLALLVGKIVACSLTIGIGGSGGVFAPSLFCGAMLGAAFGDVVHAVVPGSTAARSGAYALVGMGAVFAGAARAPITAVVILFELTGEYSIILPLMLAIVAGHRRQPPGLARHRLHPQAAAAAASTSTNPPTPRCAAHQRATSWPSRRTRCPTTPD